MAETTRAVPYEAMLSAAHADSDHWAVPHTAMFVTLASAGLWALIFAGVHWLLR